MSRLKSLGQERRTHTVAESVDADASSAAGEDAAARETSRSSKSAALPVPVANVEIITPSDLAIAKVTTAKVIRELDKARRLALKRGQAHAAVTATMAKAKLAGLLKERPEGNPECAEKFDGNYIEAARRVALLLRLADDQMAIGRKR